MMTWLALLSIIVGAMLVVMWDAKRRATKDAREANQFLRDMGAPSGLRVIKPGRSTMVLGIKTE